MLHFPFLIFGDCGPIACYLLPVTAAVTVGQVKSASNALTAVTSVTFSRSGVVTRSWLGYS